MNKISLLTCLFFISFILNTNAQVFEAQKSYFPDLGWGCAETADFDLDGDLDLLLSGRDAQNLAITKIFRNDNGRFIDINADIENVMLSSAAWADLNGDKYPDFIISGKNNSGQSVTFVYRNWQNGTFAKVPTNFQGVSSGAIAVADYDLDGQPDILLTGRSESTAISKIYRNEGLFSFKETSVQLTGVYYSSAAFADFNNDKSPDIIISGESGMNRYTKLYLNKNGTFIETECNLPQLGSGSLVCADLNGDKNIDIIISGLDVFGNEKTVLFTNDGNFKFTDTYKSRGFIQADYVLPNIAYGSINIADLDNDNDPDLVFTGKGSTKIASVYINEGNLSFKKAENTLTGVYHSSLAILDFNGDKKPDMVYSGLNEEGQLISSLFINKGAAVKGKTEPAKESTIKPSFTTSLVKVGDPAVFKNETKNQANKVITFTWNFGDGTESTTENPSHTYTKEGKYTVILTARAGDIIETATKQIYARPQNIETINFTDREKLVLNTEALKLLLEYETLINKLGAVSKTNEKESTDLREQIINLFLNRKVIVNNDLDPTGATSKLKEIETYTSDISLLYPDGIKVSVDLKSPRMTSIKQHNKSLYSVDIISTKRIDGNFNNKAQNANNYKLAFRVAFTKEGSDFKNFKFVGIRDYYEQSFVADEQSMQEVNKAEITKAQQEQIDISSKNVLTDYIRNLSLIVKSTEEESDKQLYQEAFVNLFNDSSAQVYNDIDPEAKENAFLPTDYIKRYRTLYNAGINNINLNIDSAIFKPTLTENSEYSRYIYADKSFSGDYKPKTKHTFSENLAFKVVFKKQENSFQDFKIASVDQSSLNFYQSAAADEDTTTFQIPKIERTGFSVGFGVNTGLGKIFDENRVAEQLGGKTLWTVKPGIGYSAGLEVNYFFSNNVGLRTGIYYSSYKTEYSIASTDTIKDGTTFSKDANGDDYIKMLLSENYLSKYSLSSIDIPIQMNWISSDARKFGFFLKAGMNLSIPIKFEEETSPGLQYFGYYPSHPEAIRELHIAELKYYNNTENRIVNFRKSYSISFLASAGIYIPVGYFSNIQIGPQLLWGITDISGEGGKINSTFGEEVENLGITLRNYGLNISFNYKF